MKRSRSQSKPQVPPVLIITGMHRSGTSLTASILQGAGLFIGERLMPGGPGNEVGHFEDLDFYDFHQRALRATGHAENGFLKVSEGIFTEQLEAEARAIIAARTSLGRPWGWKDPRTVLFLDQWHRLIPHSCNLFVFRAPWEVVDSLYRRSDDIFDINPKLALDAWQHYNRLIKGFVLRHPDTSLIYELSQVIDAPQAIVADVEQRFGMGMEDPQPRYREELLVRTADPSRIAFIRELAPSCLKLYAELQELARIEPENRFSSTHATTGTRKRTDELCAGVLAAWSQISKQQQMIRQTKAEHEQLLAKHEATLRDGNARTEALKAHVLELEQRCGDLETMLASQQEAVIRDTVASAEAHREEIAELDRCLRDLQAADAELLRVADGEKSAAIEGHRANVARLEQRVGELTTTLARMQQSQTSERIATAEAHQTEIGERDRRIWDLEATLVDTLRTAERTRNAAEEAYRAHVAQLDQRVRELESQLTEVRITGANAVSLEADRHAAHIETLERRCGDLETTLARHEREHETLRHEHIVLGRIHDSMVASNSWRLTRPLRALRRSTLTKPGEHIRRWACMMGKAVWRRLPLSGPDKYRIRQFLFTRMHALFRSTQSYQDWHSLHGQSTVAIDETHHVSRELPELHSASRPSSRPPGADGARVIAMHLPQFHRIPENDASWGDGFTEWTNVRRGRPMYDGHHQPHVPHPDVGYYDLSDPQVLERQAAMAAAYGIYGFCFYYYWFDGKRLLEKPVETMLRSGKPDFPFCICWANENWTRTWDGNDEEVIIGQQHTPKSDIQFIHDILPVLRDRRYIRIDGKPLIAVYRTGLLPDAAATAAAWRKVCRDEGIGDIHLVTVRSFDKRDPRDDGFDAAIQFPPLQIPARNLAALGKIATKKEFHGFVFDYDDAIRFSLAEKSDRYPLYRGVMPAWDNTARRMERGTSWINSSPEKYGRWLRRTLELTVTEQPPGQRLVFVNAWNEWAEGAHLEPDERDGYRNLEETRVAVLGELPRADSVAARRDTLPHEPAELRQRAWHTVQRLCGTALDMEKCGFLSDHTSLLKQLAAAACRFQTANGIPLATLAGNEVAIRSRFDLARLANLLSPKSSAGPFCFVVLQHNKWDVTARCIESLRSLKSRRPVRILVVDNGSALEVLQATRDAIALMTGVDLLCTGENLGFAAGNNAGYDHARRVLGAAFVAVINNDTRIDQPDFIDRCESLYQQYAYSVLGPDILTPDGRHENPWSDVVYSPAEWRSLAKMYAEDHATFRRTGEPRFRRLGRRSPEASFLPQPLLQGAAYVLSPVFTRQEPRLFDDRTRLYGEEFLFAADCLLAGHFTMYTSSVRILHEEGVSTAALPGDSKMRMGYENGARAAGLAASAIDNAIAAWRGDAIDSRSDELPTLLTTPGRHVLVDLLFCQPGYHGGGEYGKAVFKAIAAAASQRSDVQIWAALDPSLFIDPWVVEHCRVHGVRMIAVRSYEDIVTLVNSDRFTDFFCPAIVVYTGYEYMRRAGASLPFSTKRTRIIGTLHDIRDLQLSDARERIAESLTNAGWHATKTRMTAQSFLSQGAPSAHELRKMYAAIVRDPTVDTIVTVSEYCRRSIAAEILYPAANLVVLASAEKDRVEPEPFATPHGTGIPGRFALVMNAGRPEKNAASVVAAFDRLFSSAEGFGIGDLQVVLTGLESLAELGLRTIRNPERFMALPHLPPARLEFLLSRARFLVYASFNEGFGYPPVEAMRYGTPSVVSHTSAIPEVCGDAAVYCDPSDVDSIAAAILQIVHAPPAPEVIHRQQAVVRQRQTDDLERLVSLVLDGQRPENTSEAVVGIDQATPPTNSRPSRTSSGLSTPHEAWCPICETTTLFAADSDWLRDSYACRQCHSLPRERALMYVLHTRHPDWRRLRIHESSPEMRGVSATLATNCPGYVPSQFDPSTPCGTWDSMHRYRSEDLENQTFADEAFDVVITQDVFEHIFDVKAAFREVQRTLRRGGTHILTIPLVRGDKPSRPRAVRNGPEIRHDHPAEYHGNPMSSSGSLVTWDWGYDVEHFIREHTGDDVQRISLEIPAMGIVGDLLDVIVVTRSRSRRSAPPAATADEPSRTEMASRLWNQENEIPAAGMQTEGRST